MKEVERLVGTATGLDNKRGDRLTVAAVDFLPGNQILEPVPGPSLVEQLLRHTGSFVTAAAMLGATFLLIWLGAAAGDEGLAASDAGSCRNRRRAAGEAWLWLDFPA